MKVEIIMTPKWENTSPVLKHVKDNYWFVVMNPKGTYEKNKRNYEEN